MNLTFRVNQQTITKDSTDEVPRMGSREYLYLIFTFSKDWSNLNKTLYISDGTYSDAINITEFIPVQVPSYYTQNASFTITLVGTYENTVVPTNVVTCILEQSNEVWEEVAPNPDSITYQQLIEALSKIESIDDSVLLAQKYAEDSANSAKQAEEAVNNGNNAFANALKGTASGSVLTLNDVSPVEHTMGVKVRGKNLIPYPYAYTTQTINGITFTDNGDGTITANGTATSLAIFRLVSGSTLNIGAGTFTLSGCPIGGSLKTYYIQIYNTNSLAYNDTGSGIKLTSTKQDNWDVGIFIDRNTTVENLVFKPQLESGSTASEYTPYISDLTAVPEKQWQQVFYGYCDFYNTSYGSNPEFYYAPIYTTKTFDIVVGREYTLETSNGMQGPNGLKYTCTAVENSYGGYSINCGDILVETCSEEYAQQMAETDLAYTEWIDKFRIAWVPATEYSPDFMLTIKEYAGTITKAVKLIKTNADGTVSEEYTPTADGTVNGVTSLYPCTKLSTNVEDIVIECEYNRDINKAFAALEAAIATNNS